VCYGGDAVAAVAVVIVTEVAMVVVEVRRSRAALVIFDLGSQRTLKPQPKENSNSIKGEGSTSITSFPFSFPTETWAYFLAAG